MKSFSAIWNRNLTLFKTINSQFLLSASNFISIILISRILGLEKFGIFSLAWAILLISNNIIHALFMTPLLNIVPKLSKLERKEYINNSFILLGIYCIFNAIIIFLIFSGLGDRIGLKNLTFESSFFFAISSIFTLFYEFTRRVFYSLRFIRKVIVFDIFKNFIQIILLMIILFNDLQNINLVINCYTLAILSSLLICKESIPFYSFKSKNIKATIKRNIKMSKWLLPSSLFYWFNLNIFTLLCGSLLGPYSVGMLTIIQKLYSLVGIFVQGLENWAQVEYSKILKDKGFEALEDFFKKFLIYLIFCIVSIVILVNLNLNLLGTVIFNINLENYKFGIYIYSFAVILNTINQPIKYLLNSLEKTYTNFIAEFVSMIIVSATAFYLIKYFELNGVFIGITIMKLSVLLASLIMYKKNRIDFYEA